VFSRAQRFFAAEMNLSHGGMSVSQLAVYFAGYLASKMPKEHPECLGDLSSGNAGQHRFLVASQ
jgi:hypothetical protein